MTLAEFIWTARKTMGYSQISLSKILNISQGWLSKVEAGQGVPTFFQAVEIAKALEVDIQEMSECIKGKFTPMRPFDLEDLKLKSPQRRKSPHPRIDNGGTGKPNRQKRSKSPGRAFRKKRKRI